MKKTDLSNYINILGYVAIVLGAIFGIFVTAKLSEGGMFTKGELGPMQIFVGFMVFFYHLIFGSLCIGVSKLLDNTDTEQQVKEIASTIKCQKCEKAYPADRKGEFCDECGTKL